jgi:NAD(P)H dehydrogenase (quinone)
MGAGSSCCAGPAPAAPPATAATPAASTTVAARGTAAASKPFKLLIVFFTTYGHSLKLANAAAEGARQVAGAEVTIKRIAETLPAEVLTKMHALEAAKQWEDVPVVTAAELPTYDGVLLVTPTRFGMAPAQVKTFVDTWGGLWYGGAMVGKVASVMTSSATQHGGQETTILSLHTVFLHMGMTIVGLPWSKWNVDAVNGCSPYGASTIAGPDGSRQPSEYELEGARFQGKHVAETARKLTAA